MDQRNFQYMFYGFTAAWLILFIFVATLIRRGSKLKNQIENLKRMVEDREPKR